MKSNAEEYGMVFHAYLAMQSYILLYLWLSAVHNNLITVSLEILTI